MYEQMVTGKIITMPTAVKKPCINNQSYSYTGKESSPLGVGYDAGAEKVGQIMEGRDKASWMVGMKNGVKVWIRMPSELKKDDPIMSADDEVVPKTPKAPKKAAPSTAASSSSSEQSPPYSSKHLKKARSLSSDSPVSVVVLPVSHVAVLRLNIDLSDSDRTLSSIINSFTTSEACFVAPSSVDCIWLLMAKFPLRPLGPCSSCTTALLYC